MDDIYMNNTSQNRSSNFTESMDYDFAEARFIMFVVDCIIICIGLPLTLLAIYALYSLVKDDHIAPIYVINLLITDVIQLCCLIVEVSQRERPTETFSDLIRFYCLTTSVCFMVCIAMERYLVIACPLWYRLRRTIKISVLVSL
ncbi:G-protein coupled receptor 4-like [Plectropomus leopardus]|uniref:G-protein coupled receptor 4-like n=1 Tax=Plectropomus leopardus TaxID=160734 RepID=UPI001C4D0E1D|nr:G-protein coupled receptor 4-like [Plectropomus leopardus]